MTVEFRSEKSTSYIISDDGTPLFVREWRLASRSAQNQKTVFVGHSQPIHSAWVSDLCEAMLAGGATRVVAGDLRGHGKSASKRTPLAHLDPETGWNDLKSDMRSLLAHTFDGVAYENRLIIVPNISAHLVIDLLRDWPDLAKEIVLVSPPPRQPAITKLALSFVRAKLLIKKADEPDEQTLHHLYTFLGSQLKERQHLADVMSPDREMINRLLDDPLGFPTPTLGYWKSIFTGYDSAWKWGPENRIKTDQRFLLLFGETDPMMQDGGFAHTILNWFKERGAQDIRAIMVPGARTNIVMDERLLNVSKIIREWSINSPELKDACIEPASLRQITTRFAGLEGDAEASPVELIELCFNAVHDENAWLQIMGQFMERLDETDDVEAIEEEFSRVMPFWDRSFQLNKQILGAARMGLLLNDLMERLNIGTAIVSSDGELLNCNEAFATAAVDLGLCSSEEQGESLQVQLAKCAQALVSNTLDATPDGEQIILVDGKPAGMVFTPRSMAGSGMDGKMIVLRNAIRSGKSIEGRPDVSGMLELAYGMTRQECAVAIQIAQGKSPDEISADLAITINTVRTHLKRCYEKVGVKGQAELASRLLSGPVGWM